jgi:hypothetical protein
MTWCIPGNHLSTRSEIIAGDLKTFACVDHFRHSIQPLDGQPREAPSGSAISPGFSEGRLGLAHFDGSIDETISATSSPSYTAQALDTRKTSSLDMPVVPPKVFSYCETRGQDYALAGILEPKYHGIEDRRRGELDPEQLADLVSAKLTVALPCEDRPVSVLVKAGARRPFDFIRPQIPCPMCAKRPGRTIVEIRQHVVDSHMPGLTGEHVCVECDIGFVHLRDLERHLQSASQGHCGFNIDHGNFPCTGHHPKGEWNDFLQDWARDSVCQQLRQWEQAQLHGFRRVNDDVTRIAEEMLDPGRWSVDALRLATSSAASLYGSLARRSAPEYNADVFGSGPCRLSMLAAGLPHSGTRKIKISCDRPSINADLLCAAVSGNTGVLPSLIRQDADINFMDYRWHQDRDCAASPLLAAIASGNLETVQLLVNVGADVHSTCSKRPDHKPFRMAIEKGFPEILDTLLSDALGDAHSASMPQTMEELVRCAAFQENCAIMGNLIQHGANFQSDLQSQPRKPLDTRLRDDLSRCGVTFSDQCKPLDISVAMGHVDMTMLLMKHGAHSSGGKDGAVGLVRALRQCHAEMISLLIKHSNRLYPSGAVFAEAVIDVLRHPPPKFSAELRHALSNCLDELARTR